MSVESAVYAHSILSGTEADSMQSVLSAHLVLGQPPKVELIQQMIQSILLFLLSCHDHVFSLWYFCHVNDRLHNFSIRLNSGSLPCAPASLCGATAPPQAKSVDKRTQTCFPFRKAIACCTYFGVQGGIEFLHNRMEGICAICLH